MKVVKSFIRGAAFTILAAILTGTILFLLSKVVVVISYLFEVSPYHGTAGLVAFIAVVGGFVGVLADV